MSAKGEIEKLAKFIATEMPKDIEEGTPVENAIRLLRMNQPINILFDGPPANKSGRFVEVETDDGKSINAGEWIKRNDGLWALRIVKLPWVG